MPTTEQTTRDCHILLWPLSERPEAVVTDVHPDPEHTIITSFTLTGTTDEAQLAQMKTWLEARGATDIQELKVGDNIGQYPEDMPLVGYAFKFSGPENSWWYPLQR